MTIDEAIRVNEDNIYFFEADGFQECADAVKLGIEALKRCKLKEPYASFNIGKPLPGETTE